MRFFRHFIGALALALLAGCAHPKSASQIASDGGLFNKFKPADKTSIVGKTDLIGEGDAIAVVELNRNAFPVGSFLVARDAGQNPTAVIQTTKNVRHQFQGVMIVSGKLQSDEEIVEPGPELAPLVQQNVDAYLVSHPITVVPPTIPTVPVPDAEKPTVVVPATTSETTAPAVAPVSTAQ